MSNVIEVDFLQNCDDGTGYVTDKAGNGKIIIEGVYVADICACLESSGSDAAHIGAKSENGIDYPVRTSVEELNRFCIMWLCIFDPESIKEDA
jgi:hypothetical protein